MQHATSSFAVLALLALLAGCAGGRDNPRTPVTDMGPRDAATTTDLGPRDAFVPPADLGPPDLGPRDLGPPDLGRRCVPSCATDADCQLSCPSNPTPSLPVCCDRGTGTCFNSSVAMCPAPMTGDAGMTMSM